MDTAVVLVSGGVNSFVLTGLAAKEYTLALMHVTYGQRTAERELSCFKAICKHFTPGKNIVVPLSHFGTAGGSAKVDKKLAIEDARTLGDAQPATYMPGLIPTMLGLAFHWASAIGAKQILIGSSENDARALPRTSVLFPDHKRELYHLYNQLVEMTARSESKIQVRCPMIEMTRGEVILLGQRLALPFALTWSCDRNTETPCGTCYGCAARAQGFVDAAVPDPILITEEGEDKD